MVFRVYVTPKLTYEDSRSYAHVLVYFFPQLLSLAGKDRITRGIQLARLSVAYGERPGLFDVTSQTLENGSYEVDTKERTCTCKDSQAGNICKHRIAVAIKTQASDLLFELTREHISDPVFVEDILQGRSI